MTRDPLFKVTRQVFLNREQIDHNVSISGDFGPDQFIETNAFSMSVEYETISFDDAIKLALETELEIKHHGLARKVVIVLKECGLDFNQYLAERDDVIATAIQI